MTCEVWLEIGDGNRTDSGGDALSVAWRWQVRSKSGSAEIAFSPPLTKATRALMQSYVRDFRSWRAKDRDWALTAERTMLNLGRALGNALVDGHYQLLSFGEWLEREGVSALHVSLVSDQAALQALPWELLILPDSPYVLSAASAAFIRAPAGTHPFQEPARALGLHAEQPLGYLRLDTSAQTTLRASGAWAPLGWQGALRHRLAPALCATDGTWHIVHWSGALTTRDGSTHLTLDDGMLSARDFVAQARSLGAELLLLEPSVGSDAADDIARAALEAGIDNVLIFSEPSEVGWPSDWVDYLLESVRAGLPLRQAVVETRKRMQRTLLEARQAEVEPPHAAQHWHSLRHYSQRDVVFFESAQPLAPFESSEAFAALRRSLFGFDASDLPPHAAELGDRAALASLRMLRAARATVVYAAHGGGVTHTLHRVALLARANGEVERAYYWDFAREAFSSSDLLQMVAGARGETEPARVSEESVLTTLLSERELWVLDNVDMLPSERQHELSDLAARVAAAGGFCLLGAHDPVAHDGLRTFSLPALDETECIALAQSCASAALGLGPQLFALLDQLQGNPLLIRRVLAPCTKENLGERLSEARASYGRHAERHTALERFHAQRWQQLEPAWQRLLLAWLPFDGLYLQTLMVAVDRPGGERSETGRKLWSALDAPDAVSCADALTRLQDAGFVVAAGAGSSIDRSALRFLRAQRAPVLADALETQLAELVCEGLLRVLGRRGHTPGDALSSHLLANRAVIRQQIETSVRAGNYALGARACLGMHALLSRAQLATEAGAWARSLLETAGERMCTAEDALFGTAWLSVALRAQTEPLDGALAAGVGYWAERLASRTLGGDADQRTFLPLVVALLEKIHDQTGDLAAYRTVAEIACDHYRSTRNTLALIPQLKALAAAEHSLGNHLERDRLEEELMHAKLYDDLPDAARLRQQTLAALAGDAAASQR